MAFQRYFVQVTMRQHRVIGYRVYDGGFNRPKMAGNFPVKEHGSAAKVLQLANELRDKLNQGKI